MKKRILSSLLSIVLLLTSLESTAFAALNEIGSAISESKAEDMAIQEQEEQNISETGYMQKLEYSENDLAVENEMISEEEIDIETETEEQKQLLQTEIQEELISVSDTSLMQEESDTMDTSLMQEESDTMDTSLMQGESNTMDLEEELESETMMDLASEDDIANGVVDESYGYIIWSIDKNGKLTVKGTGNYTNLHGWHSAPWYDYRDDILSAEIRVTGMTQASYMFEDCSNLTEIDLSRFDTSKIVMMYAMFAGCSSLQTLDLSSFDTSSVTQIGALFNGCSSLEHIDVSNFKTNNVLYMDQMFSGCSKLKSIDLSNFNTANVKSMNYMFSHCKSLTSLNLNNFNTSEVTDMSGMFASCEQLTELNIQNFNTANVLNMEEMFDGCTRLEVLDLSHFYTDKIENVRAMFAWCSSLISLDLSGINAEKVTDYEDIFLLCDSLTQLYTPYNVKQPVHLPVASGVWTQPDGTEITELPQNLEYSILISKNNRPPEVDAHLKAAKQKTIYQCGEELNIDDIIVRFYDSYGNVALITEYATNKDEIDMSTAGTKELIIYYDSLQATIIITVEGIPDIASGTVNEAYGNISWVIDHEGKLTVTGTGNCMEPKHFAPWEPYCEKIITAEIDVKDMTDASTLFWHCTNLTSVDISHWDTSKITTMCSLFEGCSSLEKLDLNNLDTSNVTDMSLVFYNCSNLKELDLSRWNTASAVTMYSMFGDCKALKSLNISGFQTGNVSNMMFMFSGCNSLESLDISTFDTKNVTNMCSMFQDCSNITSINLDNFNTENVTDMMYMFNGCNRLTQLDLSHFDTQNVTNMRFMFHNCSSAKELNITNFQTQNVTDMSYMFAGCQNLTSLELSSFSLDKLENVENMFGDCVNLSCIHTPKNCTKGILLPISESTDKWCMEDGTICTELPVGLTDSIVLYKNRDFVITCTVTYDLQGRGQNLLATVNQGEKLTPPEAPTAEGTRFDGWYKEADCINAWDFYTDIVMTDMVLYAKWTDEHDDSEDVDDSPYTEQERIDLNTVNGIISAIKRKNYDGNPYEPIVKVTITENGKKKTITEGTDYRVLYSNNINAGKNANIIIRGNGIYKGELSANFEITPKTIKKLKITANTMTVGETSKPSVYIYDGTKLLVEGTDYILHYSDSLTEHKTNAAKITINGINNYTGSTTVKIAVYENSANKIICSENVTLTYEKTDYTGKAVKDNEPIVMIDNVRLTKNKHYKVQYQNNVNAGTAFVIVTGKGGYKGKVVKPFIISPADITLAIKPISAKTYSGKLQKPVITVKSGNKKLKKNKDYIVTYKNNLHTGTASVLIKGKGNYEGVQAHADFIIQPQKITKASIKGTKTKGLTLTYAKKVLKQETDYSIVYGTEQKNKIQVTITGKGDFTGIVTKMVKIR